MYTRYTASTVKRRTHRFHSCPKSLLRYQVDGKVAAKIIADLLAPGGHLLMLTGNSEDLDW